MSTAQRANYRENQLGSFMDFELWEDAIKLLRTQVQQMHIGNRSKKGNRHFNTFSMFYYRKIASNVEYLEEPSYFGEKIANNLFYGLEHEFQAINYLMPKSGLGVRGYKFFTYPLRVLYYAFGIYLLHLSDEFLRNYVSSNPRILSFYGGNLQIENNRLHVTSDNIYYLRYYQKYRRKVRQEANSQEDLKVIIRLDVQNYFDEISIPILLRFIQDHIKQGVQRQFRFNSATIEQIECFFRYLSNDTYGIPQADNDIISSFIAHLYLVFGDLYIEDEIRKYADFFDEYKIIRYVDDIFISLTFKQNLSLDERETCISTLGSQIADLLYHRFHLRLNTKTRFFWMDKDKEEFLKTIKRVSPQYEVSPDEDSEPIQNKVNRLMGQIIELRSKRLRVEFEYEKSPEEEIFKDIFDRRVNQLLDKPENKRRIRQIFEDFKFDLVKVSPRELIIILLKVPEIRENFKQFLMDRENITTKEVILLIHFLCQTSFEDDAGKLLEKLKLNEPMQIITQLFEHPNSYQDYPGYYELDRTQILHLYNDPYIIEQIQLRVINERLKVFSVALNHLLNEIHRICYINDINYTNSASNYDANDVINFLESARIPNIYRTKIRNLFERRNRNLVSHPSSENYESWAVTEDEYQDYHRSVGECLKRLLK